MSEIFPNTPQNRYRPPDGAIFHERNWGRTQFSCPEKIPALRTYFCDAIAEFAISTKFFLLAT
jgi:hypothetical protein